MFGGSVLASVIAVLPVDCATAAPAIAGPRPASWSAVLASARQAAGAAAWRSLGTFRIQGIYTAGNEPGTFDQTVDFHAGLNRTDVKTGSLENFEGFDGGPWTAQNGIVTRIDLPSLVSDARSRAFVLRDGWRDPTIRGTLKIKGCPVTANCVVFAVPQGSPVTIWFDKGNHLPSRAVIDVDDGVETTMFSDWRNVEGHRLAFRRVVNDSTGATTTLTVQHATFNEIGPSALAPPGARAHGFIQGAKAVSVPFEYTAFDRGHIVVPATLNGRAAKLLFDSGGANYFTPVTATAAGLKIAGGVNIGGVGEGTEEGGFAHITQMSIGGAVLRNEAAIIGPLPYPALNPRAGITVDGLTGYEFLSEFRTTIDYAARALTFASFDDPAPKDGVTVPFFSDGHSIYVSGKIDGVSGLFRLDTGDGGALTVFRNLADRYGLFQRGGRRSLQAGGVGGAITSREVMGQTFELGGSVTRDMPVSISDTKAGAFFSRSLAGNLGSAILARFKIIFDYRARTLTFVPNATLNSAYPRDRSGLSVTQDEPSALKVLPVATNSPAARAGVRAGDRIVTVDGRSVVAHGLGLFDLTPLRSGSKSFSLALQRAGRPFTVTIVPMEF